VLRDGKLSKDKLPAILQETEKGNTNTRTPFSNVHLEGNDTIILWPMVGKVMPRDGKNAALSKKVWQYDYSY
jgi:hypothetical protein